MGGEVKIHHIVPTNKILQIARHDIQLQQYATLHGTEALINLVEEELLQDGATETRNLVPLHKHCHERLHEKSPNHEWIIPEGMEDLGEMRNELIEETTKLANEPVIYQAPAYPTVPFNGVGSDE